MMKLQPQELRSIDYRKTKNNVANWFKVEYSKYKRLANIPEISSVRMSLAPKSTVHANGIEDLTVTRANAKDVLKFVDSVLDTLDERHKKIIKGKFIQGSLDWQIAQSIQYSNTRYHQLKLSACYEFAQILDMTAGTRLVAYKE